MYRLLRIRIAAIALLLFAGDALCNVPASIDEVPQGDGTTQYSVFDTSGSSAQPFDISLILVATSGSDPSTTNSKWSAESVDATSWDQDMAGESLTWQEYTGLTYAQAFPDSAAEANGYFLNYSTGPEGEVIFLPDVELDPGTSMGGFFFQGSPDSTFLVAGPTAGSTSFGVGHVVTYAGVSTDVPEPAAFAGLAMLVVCFAGLRQAHISR